MDPNLEDLVNVLNEYAADIPLVGRPTTPAAINAWRGRNKPEQIADYTFEGHDLRQVSFSNLKLTNIIFKGCTLTSADFSQCKLNHVSFSASTVNHANFTHTEATKCDFKNCDLRRANFATAELSQCDFSGSVLTSANFDQASISDSDFRNVAVDSKTTFKDLKNVSGMKLDRYTLASLGEGRGSLTEGNLMKMQIVDDVAILRSQFGGLWAWAHLLAIVIFVFPYAWFLVRQWSIAVATPPAPDANSMSLLQALLRFIVTGGGDWKHTWTPAVLPLVTFAFFFAYNMARLALLWKTKQLETQQMITGVPVEFSLQTAKPWNCLYQFARLFFIVAMLAAAINTFHFMMKQIPI